MKSTLWRVENRKKENIVGKAENAVYQPPQSSLTGSSKVGIVW